MFGCLFLGVMWIVFSEFYVIIGILSIIFLIIIVTGVMITNRNIPYLGEKPTLIDEKPPSTAQLRHQQ
jgi:hypothetical protein